MSRKDMEIKMYDELKERILELQNQIALVKRLLQKKF